MPAVVADWCYARRAVPGTARHVTSSREPWAATCARPAWPTPESAGRPVASPSRRSLAVTALEDSVNTSCDTLVALGSETRNGRTLFAKNSDRPTTECQPLQAGPARRPRPGRTVRGPSLEIPEPREPRAFGGSRPWGFWASEHGVNEAGVAIGNEAPHPRETPAETGLLGMDLLRLGLER